MIKNNIQLSQTPKTPIRTPTNPEQIHINRKPTKRKAVSLEAQISLSP